ncbi:MAG: hypothetical protein LBG52_05810 [Candidatus Peribacteria bacterium]|nr:hypothetical protein [Candidatus Peribacteria bacterium]
MSQRLLQAVYIKQYEGRTTKQTFEDANLTKEERLEFRDLALKLIEDKDMELKILHPNPRK